LSAQKWGTISVHGNREFMRTCVELAAEHGGWAALLYLFDLR
jgi:hypothetical protein